MGINREISAFGGEGPMAGVRKVEIVVEVPIEIGNDDGFYCGEGCGYLINFERCAVCGLVQCAIKKEAFYFSVRAVLAGEEDYDE